MYFFFRSVKDGYLGANSEEPKYRMLRTTMKRTNASKAQKRRGDHDETENQKSELKEYAGGWITERKGTRFRASQTRLSHHRACLVVYLFIYMNGEVNHSTRGPLVQQLNAVTGTADGFMYIVARHDRGLRVILLAFRLRQARARGIDNQPWRQQTDNSS